MNQVRGSIFETNSSSVHSIVMCSESDYDRWVAGELLYKDYTDSLVTREKAIAEIEEWDKKYNPDKVGQPITEEVLNEYGYYSHDAFWDEKDEYFETFSESYNGVVAFGYYGMG